MRADPRDLYLSQSSKTKKKKRPSRRQTRSNRSRKPYTRERPSSPPRLLLVVTERLSTITGRTNKSKTLHRTTAARSYQTSAQKLSNSVCPPPLTKTIPTPAQPAQAANGRSHNLNEPAIPFSLEPAATTHHAPTTKLLNISSRQYMCVAVDISPRFGCFWFGRPPGLDRVGSPSVGGKSDERCSKEIRFWNLRYTRGVLLTCLLAP